MTNAYSDITTIKSDSYLAISTTDHDTYLRKLLEDASRKLDKWCDRFFYCRDETRYFDGKEPLRPDDFLSITTLKSDEDADAVFENTLVVTGTKSDCLFYPLNTYPKTKIELTAVATCGLANGVQKGVEITGVFGHGDGISATPYVSKGTLGAAVTSTSTTVVTMSTGHSVAAGQTIRIDSEQMYAEVVATNALTVKRNVNGAVAATHSTATTVNSYEYPAPITQGCLITAMRAFKRKDSAYADIIGSPETGQIITSKGVDPDVVETIKSYRKLSYP